MSGRREWKEQTRRGASRRGEGGWPGRGRAETGMVDTGARRCDGKVEGGLTVVGCAQMKLARCCDGKGKALTGCAPRSKAQPGARYSNRPRLVAAPPPAPQPRLGPPHTGLRPHYKSLDFGQPVRDWRVPALDVHLVPRVSTRDCICSICRRVPFIHWSFRRHSSVAL